MSVKARDLKVGDKIRHTITANVETVQKIWVDEIQTNTMVRSDDSTLRHFEKVEEVNDPTQWRVGDMAYIPEDNAWFSKGDLVKVTALDRDGKPLRGKRKVLGCAYRVLTKEEANDLPPEAVLVRVGNYWSSEVKDRETIKANVGYSHATGLYALKSMPDPEPVVDPVKEERLKRIKAMEQEIAELRKLEES